ncbi:MAG TPA: glycosyltransferase [Azoarcus taiwanensis]|nr:glycosyltransferase [Azoarcus taiwanensis]
MFRTAVIGDIGWQRGANSLGVAEIWLNPQALTAHQSALWQSFLMFARRSMGAEPVIHLRDEIVPVDGADFAFVSASGAVSRKLLLSVPRVYVEPSTAPENVDPFFYGLGKAAGEAWALVPAQPTVALISSVFDGDRFLAGFLANSAALEGYDKVEHYLIRAGSPGNEHSALVAHVRAHPGAVYVNLSCDPGLYAVWNFGLRLTNARFVSNANIDDRRAPTQLKVLVARLQAQPELAAVSSALRVSTTPNREWADTTAQDPVMFGDVPEQVYGATGLFKWSQGRWMSHNLPHCMPVWRRFLHAQFGEFDEKRYGPSADWAFWLHAARGGARYHFCPQPLGLYLRDEKSYWRRDASNRRFDERIADEFSDVTRGTSGRMPPLGRPLGLVLPTVIQLMRMGAVLEAVVRLLSALALAPKTDTSAVLLDRMLGPFLGRLDWFAWAARHVASAHHAELGSAGVTNAVVDLVEGYDALALGANGPRVTRYLSFACLDLVACLGDDAGWAAWAALSRRVGDVALERTLLQMAHGTDRLTFWTRLQVGYRFQMPLADVMKQVGTLRHSEFDADHSPKMRVVFYPNYKNNAYLQLLYAPLVAAGGTIQGALHADDLLRVSPEAGCENILHLHWVNQFFEQTTGDEQTVSARLRRLLDGLASQQTRGFKVYWTIHNYLSHESGFPELERAFRQALYKLADRVFVHHPLAAELLDWLPDHSKLSVAEHGPYPVEARPLDGPEGARRRLALDGDDWVVGYVGQIRDYKGVMRFLPTLLELLNRFPRLKLLIAGVVVSPQAKAWLSANAHPNMRIIDAYLSDAELEAVMKASDVGLLTYDRILTSGTLFHWLSAGRPVIAPNMGTIPAYVVDSWNGWCYESKEKLIATVEYAMSATTVEKEYWSKNARQTASALHWGMWRGEQGGRAS